LKKKEKEASVRRVGALREIVEFIRANEETLTTDKWAIARMKLTGPNGDTNWMNVSIDDLKKLARVL